jgi:glutathionylspermidine synthase
VRQVLAAGANLSKAVWTRLKTRAIFDFCKWDPHCEDHSVLASFPLFVSEAEAALIGNWAEKLTHEALAAETEILEKPQLMERLGIPRAVRRVLGRYERKKNKNEDVRVMRFDFHFTMEGWRISEVNADVPGGYVEASGWNELFATEYSGARAPSNPTRAYVDAIRERIGEGAVVALAHATVYSEDRQVMVHLAKEMSRQHLKPCLISPAHLSWKDGRAELRANYATGCPAMVVRLLPAEWLPHSTKPENWRPWFAGSCTQLSNPGSALVLQSKRFPLVWDDLRTCLKTWRRLLPETVCPGDLSELDSDHWVLKPALGRVGEDVGIRGVSSLEEYGAILGAARRRPEAWVAQRRFSIVPLETSMGAVFPCIGVYTVNGKAAGLYGRVAANPLIDHNAQDAAVLLRADEKEVAG